MTTREVHADWREYVLPEIRAVHEADGIEDNVARCESFNNYTDFLCKDGRITNQQYANMSHPRECK